MPRIRPRRTGPRASSLPAIRGLLFCGAVAGPVFVVVTTARALSQKGFDIRRHGISLLSLGDDGWIQVANFVVAGALSLAFAQGVRRALGPGNRWIDLLISGYGVGLIATGVFLVDPGAGFPPGMPEGTSPALSWHGGVHALAPPAAFACLVATCFMFARRSAGMRRMGWATYSAATGIAAAALIFWPGSAGSVRSALAVLITSTWTTAVAVQLLTVLPHPPGTNGP